MKFYKGKSLVKRFYDFITNNNLEREVASSITKLVNGYKNNELEKDTNQEIIFICKQYYLLDTGWLDRYKKYIEQR